jgi:hypothetical protein
MTTDLQRAIREVIEAWDSLDSPDEMAGAIYQLRRTYKEALDVDDEKRRRKKPQRAVTPQCRAARQPEPSRILRDAG